MSKYYKSMRTTTTDNWRAGSLDQQTRSTGKLTYSKVPVIQTFLKICRYSSNCFCTKTGHVDRVKINQLKNYAVKGL